jgi:hypothetical protein
MLPLWVYITFGVLFIVIVGLLWRMKNCRCSLYEKFEDKADADATDADKPEAKADAETETEEESKTETKAEVKTEAPEKETVEEEVPVALEKEKEKKKGTAAIADKFMNYSEMKIFDNLRENAYSLQDIKRMIREGEITTQMIEKFLARVEKMEDRSSSEKTSSKKAETMLEGFSGSRFANAYFN